MQAFTKDYCCVYVTLFSSVAVGVVGAAAYWIKTTGGE